MIKLNKGNFINVNNDIGIVVFLEKENNIPNKHIGIWYGETNNQGIPKYKTVPIEYCKKVESIDNYH